MTDKVSSTLLPKNQDSRLDVVVAETKEVEMLLAVEEAAVIVADRVKTVEKEVRAVEAEEEEEATEREAVESADQEASTVAQAEAVVAAEDARETKDSKMVRELLSTLLRLVASERDTPEKLVKMPTQWTANLALDAERETRPRVVLEKVTGVTTKPKSRLVKKRKKKRRK